MILKAWGLCLLCALVEVGHRLSVEVDPGVVVGIRGLLGTWAGCLAPTFVVLRSAALGLVLLTVVLLALRLPYLKGCAPSSSGHERLSPMLRRSGWSLVIGIHPEAAVAPHSWAPNSLIDQLAGLLQLLRGASDGEDAHVGVGVGWRVSLQLYVSAGLLLDVLDGLSTFANHKAALVSGDGVGHLLQSSGASHATVTSATASHSPPPKSISLLSCLNQFIDEVHRVVAVVGLAHHLSNSVRTDSVILFELDPDPGIILNLFDHFSVPTNDDADSKSGHDHIQTASPHFGSKVCSASPEVTLVLVPDELHHKFTGLLHFVGIPSDSQGLVCSSGHGVILNHDHLHSCSLLQLFDGFASFADDQANFVGRDEDLLDGTVAVHVTVEAWTVPTLLHNLTQQPLGLVNVLWAAC